MPTRSHLPALPRTDPVEHRFPAFGVDVFESQHADGWRMDRAQHDFLNDEVAYPLKVARLVPAKARCPLYDGFRWAEPSYEHLRFLMRRVFENRAEALQVGLRGSAFAHANFTWDRTARKIIGRLEEMDSSDQTNHQALVAA